MLFHQCCKVSEYLIVEFSIADLSFQQFVFVDQKKQCLVIQYSQALFDKFRKQLIRVLIGCREWITLERILTRAAHRLCNQSRYAAKKSAVAIDHHFLHIDKYRHKALPKTTIDDLIKDRALSCPALAAKYNDDALRCAFHLCLHISKVIFAAKKHAFAADRISDDIRIGFNRHKLLQVRRQCGSAFLLAFYRNDSDTKSDHGKPGEREKPPLQVKRNGDFNRNFRGIYAVQIVIETADLERKRSRRQIIVRYAALLCRSQHVPVFVEAYP